MFNKTVERLNLFSNRGINAESAESLCDFLNKEKNSLKHINLSDCAIQSQALATVCHALAGQPAITHITLSLIGFDALATAALGFLIGSCTSRRPLELLDISYN